MLAISKAIDTSACDLQFRNWDPNSPMRRVLLAVGICVLLAAPAASLRAAEWAGVVFMYHRFGETQHPSTSVPLERFEAQLDWLQAEDFEVWSLSRLMQARTQRQAVPERVVAITVDDAYASVYHQAWPRLRERGWPLTVFVATGAVDSGYRDMMSWSQMREMRDAGVEFANHSVSHSHMHQLLAEESPAAWRERMRAEIDQAQQRLQAELGASTNENPRLFAYPYGEYSLALMELLEQQGYLAFGQHSGAIGLNSPALALPRYPINTHYGDAEDFALKALSLPLPVVEQQPLDPILGSSNPPALRLHLGESRARLAQLACYASGQGPIEVMPASEGPQWWIVRAPAPLPAGRSRYNCTAPHGSANRWYWYSQLWIGEVVD